MINRGFLRSYQKWLTLSNQLQGLLKLRNPHIQNHIKLIDCCSQFGLVFEVLSHSKVTGDSNRATLGPLLPPPDSTVELLEPMYLLPKYLLFSLEGWTYQVCHPCFWTARVQLFLFCWFFSLVSIHGHSWDTFLFARSLSLFNYSQLPQEFLLLWWTAVFLPYNSLLLCFPHHETPSPPKRKQKTLSCLIHIRIVLILIRKTKVKFKTVADTIRNHCGQTLLRGFPQNLYKNTPPIYLL